jgi:cation:H+ antiporter
MMMREAVWLGGFAASAGLVLLASDRLVNVVEAAGDRYSWPPGVVGLLAAAGADGPEVSAAIIALLAGSHAISLGVILGSNLFNLAALLGLPIVLLGYVAVQRLSLLVNGAAMLLTTLLAGALLLGVLPPPVVGVLVAVTIVGYALALSLPRETMLRHVPFTVRIPPQEPGDVEVEERARERDADQAQGFPSGWRLLVQGILTMAAVIAGCDMLVNATLYLGPRLGVPQAVTGTFLLAALTSLPNIWVAMSLVARRRGAVLVSAVCNSNTINVVFGICVPALFISLRAPAIVRQVDLPALALLTFLALGLIWYGRGLGRLGAGLLLAAYVAFVAARLALTPGLHL